MTRQIKRGQPVISVDTKQKELVKDFKNAGREWQPEVEPEEVRAFFEESGMSDGSGTHPGLRRAAVTCLPQCPIPRHMLEGYLRPGVRIDWIRSA